MVVYGTIPSTHLQCRRCLLQSHTTIATARTLTPIPARMAVLGGRWCSHIASGSLVEWSSLATGVPCTPVLATHATAS
jgi:hypothetical protein